MNSAPKQTQLEEMTEEELASVCGGDEIPEKEYRPIYYFYYPYGGGSSSYSSVSV